MHTSKTELSNAGGRFARYDRLIELLKHWSVVRLLACGGTMLVILGLTGVLGLLGSISRADLFHEPNWINWLHLSFGLFVLTVAMVGSRKLQIGLALLAAFAGSALGFVGLIFASYAAVRYRISQSIDISDPIAHLTVGLLAIWALRNMKRERSTA